MYVRRHVVDRARDYPPTSPPPTPPLRPSPPCVPSRRRTASRSDRSSRLPAPAWLLAATWATRAAAAARRRHRSGRDRRLSPRPRADVGAERPAGGSTRLPADAACLYLLCTRMPWCLAPSRPPHGFLYVHSASRTSVQGPYAWSTNSDANGTITLTYR